VCAEIIAMLVVSVCLLAIFICWEWYIENRLKRPPLLKLALFTRGKGKLSVVYGFIVSIVVSELAIKQLN
jgi:uncharacterized membrane protein YobD (UPF0266 family)